MSTLDLPSHGRDTTPADKVSMTVYRNAVIQHLQSCPPSVILVGHSMAGAVISSVAEHISSRIQGLVYVAGFVPKPHGTLWDVARSLQHATLSEALIWQRKQKVVRLNPTMAPSLLFNTCPDAQYATQQLQPEPFLPWRDPIVLTAQHWGSVPKHYLVCTADQALPPEDQQHMIQALGSCSAASLDSDHAPFYSSPHDLIRCLLEAL